MNDRINIQDLSNLLVSQHALSKENADALIREFFSLIKTALERDKYVKIKGLGVFKLIEVDARESMNINTKERFEIPRYTKVSFTPDATLRDTINKPFAHFETVILNENTVFDDKNEDKQMPDEEKLMEELFPANQSEAVPDENTDLDELNKETAREEVQMLSQEVAMPVHKSSIKLYITLVILLLILLGCIFFFMNRSRMAEGGFWQELENENAGNPHIQETLPTLSDDSLVNDKGKKSRIRNDSILLISSQTPVRSLAED